MSQLWLQVKTKQAEKVMILYMVNEGWRGKCVLFFCMFPTYRKALNLCSATALHGLDPWNKIS